jgi:hypothetical protein
LIRNKIFLKIKITSYPKKGEKVMNFYNRYHQNRHKAVILPPSVHLLPSPDDNRYDLRPFNYMKFSKSLQGKIITELSK